MLATHQHWETMSDITITHIDERPITQFTKQTASLGEDAWRSHQTWQAILVNSVRILHSCKRMRTVFQVYPEKVSRMATELIRLPTKWPVWKAKDKCTSFEKQTEEWTPYQSKLKVPPLPK